MTEYLLGLMTGILYMLIRTWNWVEDKCNYFGY